MEPSKPRNASNPRGAHREFIVCRSDACRIQFAFRVCSGGTSQRTCDPPGVSRFCVPGCYRFDREGGGPGWCEDGGGPTCAYKPENMLDMFDAQRAPLLTNGVPSYNEVRMRIEPLPRLLSSR